MGKDRSGKQDFFILTEINSVAEQRLDVDVCYAVSPDTVEAWALDRNQQGIEEKTGAIIQTVCERSYKPLIVFDLDNAERDSSSITQNVNTIASQQEDAEIAFMERKKGKFNLLLWIGIIATIFALTISLLVLTKI